MKSEASLKLKYCGGFETAQPFARLALLNPIFHVFGAFWEHLIGQMQSFKGMPILAFDIL